MFVFNAISLPPSQVLPQGSGTGKVQFALQLFQEVLAWANDDWEAMKHLYRPVSEVRKVYSTSEWYILFETSTGVSKDRIQAAAALSRQLVILGGFEKSATPYPTAAIGTVGPGKIRDVCLWSSANPGWCPLLWSLPTQKCWFFFG